MAKNYIREGKSMYLTTVSGAVAGDAFVVGDYLPCVLLTDADAGDSHKATVATEGVFKLSAKGDVGEISAGDMLYWLNKDTPLDKTAAGKKAFGIALEGSTHASNAIQVLLVPKATVPDTVGTSELEDDAVTTGKILNANVTRAKLHVTEVARYVPSVIAAPAPAGTLTATVSGIVLWDITGTADTAAGLAAPAFAGQELMLILNEQGGSGNLVVTVAATLNGSSSNRKITFDDDGEWIKLVATSNEGTLQWHEIGKTATVGAV